MTRFTSGLVTHLTLLVMCVTTACAGIQRPALLGGPSDPDLNRALALAQAYTAKAQFDHADSVLAAFAERYPGTPEALETAYWRALYRLDPAAHGATVTGAMALLDGYLTDTRLRQHVSEAITLRRLAGQLDALNKLAAAATSQAKDATRDAANARAQAADAKADAKAGESGAVGDLAGEIKRLKDELAKANAELDRIRRRLSQPPPKP
jgi:hypothetical protein